MTAAAAVSNHDLAVMLTIVGLGLIGLAAYLAYLRALAPSVICAVVGLCCVVIA